MKDYSHLHYTKRPNGKICERVGCKKPLVGEQKRYCCRKCASIGASDEALAAKRARLRELGVVQGWRERRGFVEGDVVHGLEF